MAKPLVGADIRCGDRVFDAESGCWYTVFGQSVSTVNGVETVWVGFDQGGGRFQAYASATSGVVLNDHTGKAIDVTKLDAPTRGADPELDLAAIDARLKAGTLKVQPGSAVKGAAAVTLQVEQAPVNVKTGTKNRKDDQ